MDISSRYKRIVSNEGAVSIEALITVPIFILVMITLIFCIRFLAIDDSFNQCLYESTLEYSMLDNTSSDIINSSLFNIVLRKNMSEMDLKLDGLATLVSEDDYLNISAFYSLESPLSKPLIFKEKLRIYKSTKEFESYVYITPSGKKYHYKDCILTKGNGEKYNINDIPEGIDACKNCILGKRYFHKK